MRHFVLALCCSLTLSACSPEPNDADYCNILFVPSLAEAIGLDLETRIRLAERGADVLRYLRGGSDLTPPGAPVRVPDLAMSRASKVADELGTSRLERAGRETRAALSPEAQQRFLELFGDVQRVTYRTEDVDSGDDVYYITFGWAGSREPAGESLSDLENRLEYPWRMIPSVDEARRLQQNDDSSVRSAAETWLAKNGFAHETTAGRAQAKRDARREEMRERHRQMREEHDRKFREIQERFAEQNNR